MHSFLSFPAFSYLASNYILFNATLSFLSFFFSVFLFFCFFDCASPDKNKLHFPFYSVVRESIEAEYQKIIAPVSLYKFQPALFLSINIFINLSVKHITKVFFSRVSFKIVCKLNILASWHLYWSLMNFCCPCRYSYAIKIQVFNNWNIKVFSSFWSRACHRKLIVSKDLKEI